MLVAVLIRLQQKKREHENDQSYELTNENDKMLTPILAQSSSPNNYKKQTEGVSLWFEMYRNIGTMQQLVSEKEEELPSVMIQEQVGKRKSRSREGQSDS